VTAIIATAAGGAPAHICEAIRTGGNPLFVAALRYLIEENWPSTSAELIELSSFDAADPGERAQRDRAASPARVAIAALSMSPPWRANARSTNRRRGMRPPGRLLAAVERRSRVSRTSSALTAADVRLPTRLIRQALSRSPAATQSLHRRVRASSSGVAIRRPANMPSTLHATSWAGRVAIRHDVRHVDEAASRALAATAPEDAARLYRPLTQPASTRPRCETLLRLGEARKR
jgi:hypothetical protein